jgi:hypothetical protein
VIENVIQALGRCGTSQVTLHVTSEGLKYEGRPVDVSGSAERGLVLLLNRAFVTTFRVATDAPARDLNQFCELLAAPDELLGRTEEFEEILKLRGISTIEVHVITSHQTIEAGAIPVDRLALLTEARRHSADRSDRPAEGGWVRVDPSVTLDRIGLSELPLVLPDASRVAIALRQLNGRRRESMTPGQALVAHFQHVSDLYRMGTPGMAAALLPQLADSLRQLPDPMKEALFREELGPALVDGDPKSEVIAHLDDEEIAQILPTLLDLGIGGVEMLSIGLSNLHLSDERRDAIVELLTNGEDGGEDGTPAAALGGGAESLLTLKSEDSHEIAPLAAFDLSVDGIAEDTLRQVLGQIEQSDEDEEALRFCGDLVTLSADPYVVRRVLGQCRGLYIRLESSGRLAPLADSIAHLSGIAGGGSATSEIRQLVQAFLEERITPAFVRRTAASMDSQATQALSRILTALDYTGADLLVATLQTEPDRRQRRRLLAAARTSIDAIAPGLAEHLGNPNWYVVRNLLSVLGHAGAGYERGIGDCLRLDDRRVVREAFLALARIGSPDALAISVRSLGHKSQMVQRQALETIWRFPAEMSHPPVREVLGDKVTMLSDPQMGRRLIRAARRRRFEGLSEIVRPYARWRFAFWNPKKRALGQEARKAGRAR